MLNKLLLWFFSDFSQQPKSRKNIMPDIDPHNQVKTFEAQRFGNMVVETITI